MSRTKTKAGLGDVDLDLDFEVSERLLAEAESKECTKGEIVVIALDKVLAELEREHNNGSPFPRVTRLKTGVNPPDLPNRDRVRTRDGSGCLGR